MAYQKRLNRDIKIMREAELDPFIVTENIPDLKAFNMELSGFSAQIGVVGSNGDYHIFFLYPEYPFKAPIHLINGVLDRSFMSIDKANISIYISLPSGYEPVKWLPTLPLDRLLYPSFSLKKMSDITAHDIGDPSNIVINIGYCNNVNSSSPGYPHRFIAKENDRNNLHLLIDPRDQPYIIVEDMKRSGILGRVIHSKLLPLESEYDNKFYKANYGDFDHEAQQADKQWFINLLKTYGGRIIITDSMYFYGNPGLTCPSWFVKALHDYPPKSYIGYDSSDKSIVYHNKCLDPVETARLAR